MSAKVAFFRPDDERERRAIELLSELGVEPVSDPMLTVVPTGDAPREDAEYTVLTSKTGVELAAKADWTPGGAVVAIGDPTAEVLEAAGYPVDVIPETFSSTGIVDKLGAEAAGATVEVARSDHGSPVLTDGLESAGAYVHETVLYRLLRPETAGESTELAAAGELDAACFTSSLTVEHFLEAAAEREILEDVIDGLDGAVVGAIGEPTRETAAAAGLEVDIVSGEATFEALARGVVAHL